MKMWTTPCTFSTCNDCPAKRDECSNKFKASISLFDISIPKWCPLPDVPDSGEWNELLQAHLKVYENTRKKEAVHD